MSDEIKIPKESSSDCSPSGHPTTPVKKVKLVRGVGRIYEDSSNNTILRVINLSDPSKEEMVVCMNEHPNVLMRNTLTIFKARQLVKRIKEEMGITRFNLELCVTPGINTPSHRVYAAYGILRHSQMAIELVTEVTVE